MENQNLHTTPAGPHFDGDVGTVTPARRLYLFQRPLDGPRSLPTESAITQLLGGHGTLATGHEMDSALPTIQESFQFISHIGAIVVDEIVYSDPNLTALQKLSAGLIYEHAGPNMRASQDGGGVQANERMVRRFTAMEFIGYTHLSNPQLDTILREILRVDRNINAAPVYHRLYWNCHDVAIRFALLAVDDDAGPIQALATLFETAKLSARYVEDFATHFGIPFAAIALLNTIPGLSPLSLGLGATTYSGAALGAGAFGGLGAIVTPTVVLVGVLNQMRRNVPIARGVYQWNVECHREVCNRCASILFLETSFPRLRGLGLGMERWQEMADAMGRTFALLGPALRALTIGV